MSTEKTPPCATASFNQAWWSISKHTTPMDTWKPLLPCSTPKTSRFSRRRQKTSRSPLTTAAESCVQMNLNLLSLCTATLPERRDKAFLSRQRSTAPCRECLPAIGARFCRNHPHWHPRSTASECVWVHLMCVVQQPFKKKHPLLCWVCNEEVW